MLFKKLYSWIKYKSLPTSFLFRNRLFIERDSKHRRIYNLYGLVFRNSKWGNYELTNITSKFKKKAKTYFYWFFLISLILTLFLLRKFFNQLDFSGILCVCGWLVFEIVDYFFVFIVWLYLFIFYTLLNWIYNYFLEDKFSITLINPNWRAQQFFEVYNKHYKDQINKDIKPAHHLKGYFYYWLNNPNKVNSSLKISDLFYSQINKTTWQKNYNFFKKLFKIVYLIKTLENTTNIVYNYPLINFFSDNKNQLFFCKLNYNNKILYNLFWFNFIFDNKKNILSNYFFLKLINQNWSFSSLAIEKSHSSFVSKNLQGLFYCSNYNFNDIQYINSENFLLDQLFYTLKNQVNIAKWNRWLYRYSILHRRILKNSHKITITKRFLQGGFFNNKLIFQNTWFNHRSPKFKKKTASKLNYIFYADYFKPKNLFSFLQFNSFSNKYFTQRRKNINFAVYEKSFFWQLKRFYNLNTISTNFISSYPINDDFIRSNNFRNSFLFSPYTLLYHFLSLQNIIHTEFDLFNRKLKYLCNFLFLKNNNFYDKDLALIFDDEDFFFNDNLDLLHWITTNNNKSYQFFKLDSLPLVTQKLDDNFLHSYESQVYLFYFYKYPIFMSLTKNLAYWSLFLN